MTQNDIDETVRTEFLWRLAGADNVLRPVEIETILSLMGRRSEKTDDVLIATTIEDALADEDLPVLQLLHSDEKKEFARLLWLVAVCDNELHPAEEKLIYRVCDLIGIDRRTQSKIQAKVLNQHIGKLNYPSEG